MTQHSTARIPRRRRLRCDKLTRRLRKRCKRSMVHRKEQVELCRLKFVAELTSQHFSPISPLEGFRFISRNPHLIPGFSVHSAFPCASNEAREHFRPLLRSRAERHRLVAPAFLSLRLFHFRDKLSHRLVCQPRQLSKHKAGLFS